MSLVSVRKENFHFSLVYEVYDLRVKFDKSCLIGLKAILSIADASMKSWKPGNTLQTKC